METVKETQEGALIGLIHSGRLSHACLISGPRGVGKRTLAGKMIKALFCDAFGTGKCPCAGDDGYPPCGEEACARKCPCTNHFSCRRVEKRTHPNLLFPQSSKKGKPPGVDEIRRDVLSPLASTALEKGNRAVLLENADQLNASAQNALLKMLEEPDGHTYFLLTADQLMLVLPTIRSRCEQIRLGAWSGERLKKTLLARGFTEEEVKEILPFCGGSIGRALEIHRDKALRKSLETVRNTFLAVTDPCGVPEALKTLRDARDNAGDCLEMLEEVLSARLSGETDAEANDVWQSLPRQAVSSILAAVIETRHRMEFNVGWPTSAERLLYHITEEIQVWQP